MKKIILKGILFCITVALIPAMVFASFCEITTVDSAGNVGQGTSLALDSSGNPHISYVASGDLKYARFDGTWHIETVDSEGGIGSRTSLALDSSGNSHISYATSGVLKYAWYDGTWHTETVDSGVGYVYIYISLALDSSGNPRISYYNGYPNNDLKYAWYDGTWHTETVDSAGNVGFYTSLALDSSGNPHISYYNAFNALKYAWFDGTWHTETVDSEGPVVFSTSLALGSSENPHISYVASDDLKYAWCDSDCGNTTNWHLETVDSEGTIGSHTSLALDSSGKPHISYYDSTNHDLKYAWYNGTWYIGTADSAGDVGSYPSLALDSSGNSHISYYDDTNGDLKYASAPLNDFDCDGILNINDNCLAVSNPGQEDDDGDNVGNVCDSCPNDYNPNQEDIDSDGISDVCDNCPDDDNPDQEDYDLDGLGDTCDPDYDGDGLCNSGESDPSCSGIDNCSYFANPNQEDSDNDGLGDVCDGNPIVPDLIPVADGHYHYYNSSSCNTCPEIEINNEIKVLDNYWKAPDFGSRKRIGIVEFDISTIDGLYSSGEMEATLILKVKEGNCCLTLYNIQDANENGTIAENDIETEDYIVEVCTNEQPGNPIAFDVTSALEHDLFDPDQTEFSGFILKGCEYGIMEFYDHTNPEHAPRLSITDDDGIFIGDNCPYDYNPLQEDIYPPQGNNIGDACDCEADFDCSGGVDANDVTSFLVDFGRSTFFNPCTNDNQCKGDFDCNEAVDATDVDKFLEDFGRSQFFNPCPPCVAGDWCVYP